MPSDVTVRMLVRPDGERVQLLVRAPLEAMQDITFPTFGPGYLDVRARGPAAARRRAALARRQPRALRRRAARAARDRRRARVDPERSLVRRRTTRRSRTCAAPPLPADTQLVWQQALLDVRLEAPIESRELAVLAASRELERLGMRVVNAVRFTSASGVERVFQIEGDAGVVPLDPRWHQSLLRFLVQGFEHILDGADHLLFLLCLVVPFRRELRTLVWIVTAFTAGHSVTLIGVGVRRSRRRALWFPPLVETLIALSIVYMAIENVVAPNGRARWPRSRSASGSCTASASRSRCRTRCSSRAITC